MTSATERIIPCPVCLEPMDIRPCRGRKSGKPFLMVICPQSGKHFRGFITDQDFVRQVSLRLEGQEGGQIVIRERTPHRTTQKRSKTNLERAS